MRTVSINETSSLSATAFARGNCSVGPDSFPYELLADIVDRACTMKVDDQPSVENPAANYWHVHLSHVNKRFRLVTHSRAHLWSSISSTMHPNMVELFIHLSQNNDLTLVVDSAACNGRPDVYSCRCSMLWSRISSELSSRIADLTVIDCHFGDRCKPLLPSSLVLPVLTKLRMEGLSLAARHQRPPCELWSMPRLRVLSGDEIIFKLSLSGQLDKLTITLKSVGDIGSGPILSLLRSPAASALTSLELKFSCLIFSGGYLYTNVQDSTVLENVTRFSFEVIEQTDSFEGNYILAYVISYLAMPNLKEVYAAIDVIDSRDQLSLFKEWIVKQLKFGSRLQLLTLRLKCRHVQRKELHSDLSDWVQRTWYGNQRAGRHNPSSSLVPHLNIIWQSPENVGEFECMNDE